MCVLFCNALEVCKFIFFTLLSQRESLQKERIEGMIAVNLQESDTAARAEARAHNGKHQLGTRSGEMILTGREKGTGIEIDLMIWKVRGGRGITMKRVGVKSGMITIEREVEKEIEIGGDG